MKLSAMMIFLLASCLALAIEKPKCIKFAGQEKCGYGCIEVTGRIYCGDKPGMICKQSAGRVKCGFDCIESAGQIECGANEGDNCVESVGRIRCGQACRVEVGQIKCGIDTNSHGR
jgi:hypothetical protein